MLGEIALRSPRRNTALRRDVPLGDVALMEYVKTLPQTLRPDGAARLDGRGVRPGLLRALSFEAARLMEGETERPPAMEWFTDNARLVLAMARQLSRQKGERLPAVGGVPRVQLLMRELVKHSDAHIDEQLLCRAIAAFDEVQPLRMAEIWAAPMALRMELVDLFIQVSETVVSAQRDRAKAAEWTRQGAHRDALDQRRQSNSFYEHALQLMHEQEMPKARQMLEEHLERREAGAEAAIQLAHAEQGMQRLLLANVCGTLRMLERLPWLPCFQALSRTEKLLMQDPAGVYPEMDEESQAAVRMELQALSRACGLSEVTVAKGAVALAEGGEAGGVCRYLYTDEGRAALCGALDAREASPKKLTPDRGGRKYMGWVLLLGLALLSLFFEATRSLLCALVAAPLAWHYAAAIINHACARLVRPHPLLKMRLSEVPDDARTLIVIPALLSNVGRAKDVLSQLEALGAQQADGNIDLLLLGDLKDGPNPREDADREIVAYARQAIARMNGSGERERFFFLCRERVFCPVQGNYMGHERKRGALMALNHLLLTGEGEFAEEGARADELHRRGYRYVVPLDAGTYMLPGTMHLLVGAMTHPLNRARTERGMRMGYALLSPRMEQANPGRLNRFARLMAGLGGVPSYPACVSDVYQDLCGEGIFGGKGIYDLGAFEAALSGRLPDGAILSHDLVEGLIAGAGQLCDVALFDAFPETPSGYFNRLNRWTRGDWQLLPFLGKLGLPGFSTYLMADNLRRSVTPVAALVLILLGLWLGNAPALLIGLVCPFVPALLALPRLRRRDWVSCALRLSLLPVECWQVIDAIVRTLYRLYFSRKNLLSWVTAADAERTGADGMLATPGRVAVILMLPALLRPEFALPAVALAALFLTAPLQVQNGLEDEPYAFAGEEKQMLEDLARDTWAFFRDAVPLSGPGLPPDNVQLSPPTGTARRTSPTNIGLYLTSCLCAFRMGLIDQAELMKRLLKTTQTLVQLPKWRGQLYNWYDIDTLQPLSPKYVSAVDGGNLAACLMACGAFLAGGEATVFVPDKKTAQLAAKMDELCSAMEFEALFDGERKLFVIGCDVERDRLSASHYDLLASESRILSFAAMALHKVPAKHWSKLGRGVTREGGTDALLSWSGTMFEYLMPELLLRAPAHSLLGASNLAAVKAQRAMAGGRIWGVSESGYNAFDLQMNYQYKAFGLPNLSLRGDAFEPVYAPYASVLALSVCPKAAAENIRAMKDRGYMGEYGLYEAVDRAPERVADGEAEHVVKSHMAHHQGMILCALTNALRDDFLVKTFMGRADIRALSLMLCERQAEAGGLSRRRAQHARALPVGRPTAGAQRRGDPLSAVPDAHLLFGAGGTCQATADGRAFFRVRGVMANRWQLNPAAGEGFYVHAKLSGRSARLVLNGPVDALDKKYARKVTFDAGVASWTTQAAELEMRLNQCVSPEDGALVQHVLLENRGPKPQKIELTGCFAVALGSQADMAAHPIFQHLFVESGRAGEHALVFRRRPRDDRKTPLLCHALFGARDEQVSFETDLALLAGRDGALDRPGGIAKKLSGTLGRVLNPCSALRVRLELAPGEKRELGFAVGVAEDEDALKKLISAYMADGAARRAQLLAKTQARAMLSFLSMNAQRHNLLQRASAFLTMPDLRFLENEPAAPCAISGLWGLGISGDLPIITVFVSGKDQLELAREAMRAHEFYRAMGVWSDLVLVNEYGNNYEQPVRDALREMAQSSHLRELMSEPGGLFLLEGATLMDTQRQLLRCVSALCLVGGEGSLNLQLARRLNRKMEPKPAYRAFAEADQMLPPVSRLGDNGWGGFSQGGERYLMELAPGAPTPAPWCNIIAGESFGTLITERGGGFTWHGNSRSGRLTPFVNDALREGFSERLFLVEGDKRLSLLPGGAAKSRFRVAHGQGFSEFSAETADLAWSVTAFIDEHRPVKCFLVKLRNHAAQPRKVFVQAEADFLMGATSDDRRLASASAEGQVVLARGAMPGVGFLCAQDGELILPPQGEAKTEVLLGWAADAQEARALMTSLQSGEAERLFGASQTAWAHLLGGIALQTPDALMNAMVSRWLPYQSLSARVFARTGFYQPGGAFGFRDQLQDMLGLIDLCPARVRAHILLCAAHQYEEGDVMHWWHPERTGVRTRISDDLLFLPYVAAQYVLETGDDAILAERVPYLAAEQLKDCEHDNYHTPQVSDLSEPLHEHCLRAIRRASARGTHGLCLMGGGDWNDGMNRVGEAGKGESVWLTEFLAAVCEAYAPLCRDTDEQIELVLLSRALKASLEEHAWDGHWYLRAYYDNGARLGSAEGCENGCRIDAIAQSWAVLAGLNRDRAKEAMDQVWLQLVSQPDQIVKLLTPPFDAPENVPGYIMGYPPGVRENGGQYTHAACWVVCAYAHLGDAERAWALLRMLMPYTHAGDADGAVKYRVEPYVLAADIYGEPPHAGRGGWTWYTGAAAWLTHAALKSVMGYERRGDAARLSALLPPEWNEASVRVRVGQSHYLLTARRGAAGVTLDGKSAQADCIQLIDDGKDHEAVFPPRG